MNAFHSNSARSSHSSRSSSPRSKAPSRLHSTSSCGVATVAIGSSWRNPSRRTVSSTPRAEPSRACARTAILRASSTPTSVPREATGALKHRGSLSRYPPARHGRRDLHEPVQDRDAIEHRGAMWRIIDFQHVKPGKGGAFVRPRRSRPPRSGASRAPARPAPAAARASQRPIVAGTRSVDIRARRQPPAGRRRRRGRPRLMRARR